MKIFIAELCLIIIIYSGNAFAGAYDQLPGGSLYIPPVSGPECVSGCDSGDTGDDDERAGSGRRPEPAHDNAQQEEEARVNAMNDANDKGPDCYEKRDWNCAIKYFQEAIEYSPYNLVLKKIWTGQRKKPVKKPVVLLRRLLNQEQSPKEQSQQQSFSLSRARLQPRILL